MIVSASRRTDIPAFYGQWFHNRVRAGSFVRINPFNPSQRADVSLKPEDVDAFVFWTKNPAPFFDYLDYLDDAGYAYYFQFTLNDYPHVFEPGLPDVNERIGSFIKLSDRIGPERILWRYDPIILSSATPIQYHLFRIKKLAAKLEGKTSRLTVSLIHYYKKLDSRLRRISGERGIQFRIVDSNERAGLVSEVFEAIGEIAEGCGMDAVSCAEEADTAGCAVQPGACVDGGLVNRITGHKKKYRRDQSQRKHCRCVESIDMGVYDTCPHLCAYCYANSREGLVKKNYRNHDPDGPSMTFLEETAKAGEPGREEEKTDGQLNLFE